MIDAVEGAVKSIIDRFLLVYAEDRLDDTELIKNIQSIIEATESFIKQNQEIFGEPGALTDILYQYARSKWLENLGKEKALEKEQKEDGYYHYYFDYIYRRGVYPP